MRKEQFDEIVDWQKQTFGQSTALSKISHLAEELQELVDDLKNNNLERRLEFADCFFLLFGAAAADGMTYEDICSAIEEKFSINKARTWGKPDENGVVRHIEEPIKESTFREH
jgi:NTP pyrophosphatase (non-canonical NTP hydrolase)